MHCEKCGGEISGGSKFCRHCGAPVYSEIVRDKAMADSGEPLAVLMPRFIGWVTALSILPLQIFFTIWGGLFFGGFTMFAVRALRLPLPEWSPFLFFGLIFFAGMPFVSYTAKKKTYARTEYRFFNDRLEYSEGFWTVENKTVKYDRIAEVSMRRGVIQRKYGLGSIFLATPATGFSHGRTASGIIIHDIEEPEKVYGMIQGLVHK